jgi:hypothetical protein
VIGRVRRVLATLVGAPQTMDPAELEERVEVLEAMVDSNKRALEEHEADQQVHITPEGKRVE